MNCNVISSLSSDCLTIKDNNESSKGLNIYDIVDALSKYSRNDLLIFRDCMDFMLIYNKQ